MYVGSAKREIEKPKPFSVLETFGMDRGSSGRCFDFVDGSVGMKFGFGDTFGSKFSTSNF